MHHFLTRPSRKTNNARITGVRRQTWHFQPVDARERPKIEDFISAAYNSAYGARIARFMPQLAALYRGNDLLAACGLRRASDEALFLETYLDVPIERSIASASAERLERGNVLEVGNLAVARPGAARMLIELLTAYLSANGEQWVAFTAVPVLRNNFRRLGIPLHVIGDARAEHLSVEARQDWGRYYEFSPQVIAIRVADAAMALGLVR